MGSYTKALILNWCDFEARWFLVVTQWVHGCELFSHNSAPSTLLVPHNSNNKLILALLCFSRTLSWLWTRPSALKSVIKRFAVWKSVLVSAHVFYVPLIESIISTAVLVTSCGTCEAQTCTRYLGVCSHLCTSWWGNTVGVAAVGNLSAHMIGI